MADIQGTPIASPLYPAGDFPALHPSVQLPQAQIAELPAVLRTKAAVTKRLVRIGVPYHPYETVLVKPVVFIFAGQSNMQGAGIGGSKVVDQRGAGIWMYSDIAGRPGGTLNRCAFGAAPFNKIFEGTGENGNTTTDPEQVTNNQAPHFMSRLRQLQAYDDDVPLWGIMNSLGGNSITKWVPNGPNFADLVGGMATLQAIWDAQRATLGFTDPDPLEVAHFCWQQGEGDSTTAVGTSNTFDLYVGSFTGLLAQLRAQPWWTVNTTVTVHEAGRWRPRYDSTGTTILAPGSLRNDAMRYLGSGQFDPQVSLVSSDGLDHALRDGDASHFDGPSLVELGYRAAAQFMSSRLGTVHVRVSRTREGTALVWRRRVDITNAVVMLGEDDVIGGAYIRAANSDIRMPGLNPIYGINCTLDVWSASTSETVIRPANDLQTVNVETGLVPSKSCAVGLYSLDYQAGRWVLRSTSPKIGDYRPAFYSIPNGGCLGLAPAAVNAALVTSFGGMLGLMAPGQGALVDVLARSTTYGNTVIGRAFNTITIANGGAGHAPNDLLPLGMSGANGTGPVVKVLTVDGTGKVLTAEMSDRGCLLDATAPTGPLPQLSSSGAGTGATFNFTITSATFVENGVTVPSLTISAANDGLTMKYMGGAWIITGRYKAAAAPVSLPRPYSASPASETISPTQAQLQNGFAFYAHAAVINLPAIDAGFTVDGFLRVWSVTSGSTVINAPGANLMTALVDGVVTNVTSVTIANTGDWDLNYTGGRYHLRPKAGTSPVLLEVTGSFTPVVSNTVPGDLTVDHASQTGIFVRHGKMVSIRAQATFTPTYTTATGAWTITGLPVAAASSGAQGRLNVFHTFALNYGTGRTMVNASVSSTIARLRAQGSGVADSDIATTGIASGAALTLTLTGTYEA